MFTPQPIGFVNSPYKDTAAIPKGLGAKHEAEGILRILPEFELGLTDIEGFSHLMVIWTFDRSHGFDLLASPPSDNRQHGVFATRSPRRPNPIGLTTVELLRREGPELHVRGVDMLDGTPVLDIKPYLSSVPAERLRRGWLAEAEARKGAATEGWGRPWYTRFQAFPAGRGRITVGVFLKAAYEVLHITRKPLTAPEIVEAARARGLLKTSGKTPEQTMK